ncbi:hypothetical protein L202_00063 [Cryptococcus amylolentus CBS 6039]|uniref:RRM domain-containing protein n=2 Tax=Cryptococcus amylolentus TaxID=104669 RepID=A0A1E3I5Q8_9TREE|nr:hypothetical protein L202_00063 [Cryptococcus amylolentus CBS 6039]ODN84034.1 hypothetical protein L202_00063 [Cryptococcus amylolentus CBS 6039]ODO12082.1 hypothetical protein I350_00868 [Cryptococcus amylolentus CBS 6273]
MPPRGRSRTPKSLSPSPPRNRDRPPPAGRARSPSYPSRSPSASRSRSPPPRGPRSDGGFKVVVVSGLSKNVQVGHLEEIFGEYGRVVRVDMPLFEVSGLNRGKAALEFENSSAAEKAKKHMDGGQLDGSVLKVDISEHPLPPPKAASSARRRSPSYSRSRSPSLDAPAVPAHTRALTTAADHTLDPVPVLPRGSTGVDETRSVDLEGMVVGQVSADEAVDEEVGEGMEAVIEEATADREADEIKDGVDLTGVPWFLCANGASVVLLVERRLNTEAEAGEGPEAGVSADRAAIQEA